MTSLVNVRIRPEAVDRVGEPKDAVLLGTGARLCHTELESTVRYLGIEADDALEMAEQTEV